MLPLALALHLLAAAEEPDPPLVAAAGVATEDGPGALWVNPAHLGYDPDPRFAAILRLQPLPTEVTPTDYAASTGPFRPQALGFTGGIAGVSAGVRWSQRAATDPSQTPASQVTADLAAGVRLPRRLAFGLGLHLHILPGARDYAAFDAGLAWRPLPWLGASAVLRNIGSPGGDLGTPAESGLGIAVRPAGRTLLLGADVVRTFGLHPKTRGVFTARVRPTRGLYLRAGVTTDLRVDAGVELYFGRVGGALSTVFDADDLSGGTPSTHPGAPGPALLVQVGTDEPGERIIPAWRQTPTLQVTSLPLDEPSRTLLSRGAPTWLDVEAQLSRVESAPDLRAVILTLSSLPIGLPTAQDLADRLRGLREGGKLVVVHLVGDVDTAALVVAAQAGQVLAHPAATFRLHPPVLESVWLGGALDAIGVEVDVARSGPYKSAAEELTRTSPSPEERAQQQALLDDALASEIAALAKGRGRPPAEVAQWLTQGVLSAPQAVQLGLVDGLAYGDQLPVRVAEIQGMRGEIQPIDLARRPVGRSPWEPPVQVGVIHIRGLIVAGESRAGALGGPTTGAATVVRQLERARRDVKVRAVVLRMDSPGGSAWASEEIARAVSLLRAAGKPVVVSMGDRAASGGYFIAATADRIWAQPATITGSIGVISTHTSFGGLLDKLGIATTELRASLPGPLDGGEAPPSTGDPDSPLRAWDPVEQLRMEAAVRWVAERFQAHVADGRRLPLDTVRELAGGRLWSGEDAKAHGLVDALGGLHAAIDEARSLAHVPPRAPVAVVPVRARTGVVDLLLPELTRDAFGLQATGGRLLGPAVEAVDAALQLLGDPSTSMWMVDPTWARLRSR